MPAPYFTPATLTFLSQLARHNDRTWFKANQHRYEEHVRGPALRFILDAAPHLQRVSPHLVADPRPVGGSLFRIQRDVRFAADKRPYKTHLGIQFRHDAGKDVHAPGLYLHIEPGNVFVACGVWHPDAAALLRIRTAIAATPLRWKRVLSEQALHRDLLAGRGCLSSGRREASIRPTRGLRTSSAKTTSGWQRSHPRR